MIQLVICRIGVDQYCTLRGESWKLLALCKCFSVKWKSFIICHSTDNGSVSILITKMLQCPNRERGLFLSLIPVQMS